MEADLRYAVSLGLAQTATVAGAERDNVIAAGAEIVPGPPKPVKSYLVLLEGCGNLEGAVKPGCPCPAVDGKDYILGGAVAAAGVDDLQAGSGGLLTLLLVAMHSTPSCW